MPVVSGKCWPWPSHGFDETLPEGEARAEKVSPQFKSAPAHYTEFVVGCSLGGPRFSDWIERSAAADPSLPLVAVRTVLCAARQSIEHMKDWRRRLGGAIVFVITLLVLYTLLYQWAMLTFEGEERTFFNAMQVVVEALTTAGFGGDSHVWNSTAMNALVILMNVSGVILVFLALPVFVFPMLREALDRAPPTESDLEDHVIICGYSRRDEVLTAELSDADIPHLYVEADPEIVRGLRDQNVPVILGDTERVETFEQANVGAARAVVADVNDEVNPTVILSAARANSTIPIYSVVHRTDVKPYHRFAGADEVVEAPRVLGESLGTRAMTSFAEKFSATVEVETPLEVTELLVEEGSDLTGQRIQDAPRLRKIGATIIGGWFDGKFIISPDPETPIQANTILLVAGRFEDMSELKARRLPTHDEDDPHVIICGHGVVGRIVAETLERRDIETQIIDMIDDPAVDIVGDVIDARTFDQADLDRSRAIVLALDQDTTTIFATLVLRNIAPDLEIIARVHEADNIWKVYNAGADFALAMSTISGEMLASLLIEDRDILIPQTEFEFVRTKAPRVVGDTLAEARIRETTGGTIVAVEREGDLITELGPDFIIDENDVLIAAGTPDEMAELVEFVH